MSLKTSTSRLLIVSALIIVAGCATAYLQPDLAALYGPTEIPNRVLSQAQTRQRIKDGDTSYMDDIEPILESRCIVCHACYDAPCQLQLTSPEGLDRGATKRQVYQGSRLNPEPPTRLFIDAHNTEEWRNQDFFPVLNERSDTPQANLNNSILSLLLQLKRINPLPDHGKLPDSFKLSLDDLQQCPSIEEFPEFKSDHPLWGMPYAMPGLSQQEHKVIRKWLLQGAKVPRRNPMSKLAATTVNRWEKFLNAQNLKGRLMARYLFEHLFLGHIHFKGHPPDQFYRLIRSTTPPGESMIEIASTRPYDDPDVVEFYYRLRPVVSTIVDKNHFVYELSDRKMLRYRELFLVPAYTVDKLPSYDPVTSSNPFRTFAAIPPQSRYQFLLDDAKFFVAGFIKGPVCRGQIALNVIRDRFWVAFVNPDLQYLKEEDDFLANNSQYLTLPPAGGDDLGFFGWRKYDQLAAEFMIKKQQTIDRIVPLNVGMDFGFLWDGGGHNQNAVLTIFRHFDSATVVKGLVGDTPLTAWVISYSVFERIHYLLVAGFNVYGSMGHQLATRKYMDYLRMEAENDFLRFMPADRRKSMRSTWYRGPAGILSVALDDPLLGLSRPSGIDYRTDDPKKEFFEKLRTRLGPAAGPEDPLNRCQQPPCSRPGASPAQQRVDAELQKITALKGDQIQALPELSFLRVRTIDGSGDLVYTLTHNKMLTNVAFLMAENLRRIREEDTVTLIPGFLGSYPNFFFKVHEDQVPEFIEALAAAQDDDTTENFISAFGVRRTNREIWALSDWFNQEHKIQNPVESGWFDLNRYLNL